MRIILQNAGGGKPHPLLRILLEVPLQQTLQGNTVAGLVTN